VRDNDRPVHLRRGGYRKYFTAKLTTQIFGSPPTVSHSAQIKSDNAVCVRERWSDMVPPMAMGSKSVNQNDARQIDCIDIPATKSDRCSFY
jgi:hypothetical protein